MADKIRVNTDLLGKWSNQLNGVSEDVNSVRSMLASLDTSAEWWQELSGIKCGVSIHSGKMYASKSAADAVKAIQNVMAAYSRDIDGTASAIMKAKNCFEAVESRLCSAFDSLANGTQNDTFTDASNPFEDIQPLDAKPKSRPIPDYTPERAFYFSTMAAEAYRMKENGAGSTDNRWEISDDNRNSFGNAKNPVTEALVTTSLTEDGELVLTISFEGSQDLYDDWLRDAIGAARNGVHEGVDDAMQRFIRDYVNNESRGMNVSLKNEYGEIEGRYSLKQLLEEVKNNPNARLRITGHSLGGAMAQYFTYYAIDQMGVGTDQVETYTFASLVPFTDEFVQKHPNLQEAKIYNVIDVRDLVPDVGVTAESDGIIPDPKDGIWELCQKGLNFKESVEENMEVLADYGSTGKSRPGGYNKSGCNIGKNIYMDSGTDDLQHAKSHWIDDPITKTVKSGMNVKDTLEKKHGMEHYQDMITHADKHPYTEVDTRDIIARKQRRK